MRALRRIFEPDCRDAFWRIDEPNVIARQVRRRGAVSHDRHPPDQPRVVACAERPPDGVRPGAMQAVSVDPECRMVAVMVGVVVVFVNMRPGRLRECRGKHQEDAPGDGFAHAPPV